MILLDQFQKPFSLGQRAEDRPTGVNYRSGNSASINRLPDRHLRRVFLYYVNDSADTSPKVFIGTQKEISPGKFILPKYDLEELYKLEVPNGDPIKKSNIRLIVHADAILDNGELVLKEAFIIKSNAQELEEFKNLSDQELHKAAYAKTTSIINDNMHSPRSLIPALCNLALSFLPSRESFRPENLEDVGMLP